MAVDNMLEDLMSTLGDFGRYQAFQFFLHILSALTAGLHMMSLVTIAADPDHRCFLEGVDTAGSIALWNSTDVTSRIPFKPNGDLDSCHMLVDNETISCSKFVYDDTYYKDTRTIDWNMVCDDRYKAAMAQTIYMLGVFTGAVTLGTLADKIGRKKVFCWSATLQLILGVGVAFVPEYYSFLFVRYLYGIFGSAGSYITGFVLTMELVGPSKRTPCGVAFQAFFAAGIMLVAGWGALIKDRQLLQVVYGLHGLIMFAHWWVMDESPRWLWTQGRHAEAIDIVAKAVKINRNPNGIDKQYYLSHTKTVPRSSSSAVESKKTYGMSDLFKTPNLRIKTLNVCLCWFANSIGYYGLSLSAGKLGGNPFFNLFILSLVEIPSYIAVILLLDRLGRRSITSSFMIVGGFACIFATFMAQKSTESTTTVFIGKLFIAGSFAVIYNYSAELFPTVVRNSAMGLGSMCARLAGAFTPLITLLDSLDPKIPAIIFGAVSLVSGLFVLFLPETNGQPMPESIEDGEIFGKGDTCFTTCFGRKPNKDEYTVPPEQQMVQELETINR